MDILIFVAIVLLASFFQGVTGFGQGLITAPVAFVLFDKATALTALIVAGIIINLYLLATIRSRLHVGTLVTLLIGAVPGLPIGILIARSVSLATLQLAVGVISIISAAALVAYKVRVRRRSSYSVAAGFFSGVFQTSIGMSAPPVVLLLTEENTAKQTMRKLLPAYFLVICLIAVVLFLPAKLLDAKGVIIGLMATPLIIYGGHAGNDEARRIKQRRYRMLVMVAVLATGLVAVYEGLSHYLSILD
ncbi:MAG TPA: sulfite exporter TauE/SafE family protein [Candidatus Saccharimonadales bacterium]|nr:sulfite exporter TauE/SafE family protein [Candidatus Saccharimonadales bacterium]